MVCLPRKCPHCGKSLMHYGGCGCPGDVLDSVDAERAAIAKRLKELEQIETDAVRNKLGELGVIPSCT